MRQREVSFLGLQNHNNGSFAMTADQVLRILRETDRENFTFIMDTGQWLNAIGFASPAVNSIRM